MGGLAGVQGIEPWSSVLEAEALPLDDTPTMLERAAGIEPALNSLEG